MYYDESPHKDGNVNVFVVLRPSTSRLHPLRSCY